MLEEGATKEGKESERVSSRALPRASPFSPALANRRPNCFLTYSSPFPLSLYPSRIIVRETEIPSELLEEANTRRAELIEQLAEVDEAISDSFLLEQEITTPEIVAAIRRCTINNSFSPVFMGSAIKNTGIQALLDGVVAYLPDPSEVPAQALDISLPSNAPPVPLVPAADANLVGLAFKLEEGKFGQLTYMRIYQGTLKKGGFIYNARTGKKMKVPRLVRMHSADMEVSLCIRSILFARDASSKVSSFQLREQS